MFVSSCFIVNTIWLLNGCLLLNDCLLLYHPQPELAYRSCITKYTFKNIYKVTIDTIFTKTLFNNKQLYLEKIDYLKVK